MSKVDRMLLNTAGINISEAANILQKSRQTITRGLSSAAPWYFRPHEVYKLVQHVEAENSSLLPMVKKFIEENYDKNTSLVTLERSEESLLNYVHHEETWLFLPELRDLKFEFPRYYEELKLFLTDFQGDINLVLKDEEAVNVFTDDLNMTQENVKYSVFTHSSPSVNCYPITFLFITSNERRVFILGSDKLTEVSPSQSNRIFYGAREVFKQTAD